MYCLHPKLHYIIKLGEKINKKEVGLVPFLESCGVETSGFKWEIGQKSGLKELKWGEMISTSNEIMGNEV